MDTPHEEMTGNSGTKIRLPEIVECLGRPQKTLPSKYFYDKRGSELFEQICAVDEYYLTDREIRIMEQNIHSITDTLGPGIDLIEFGSGSSSKTRLLLDHLDKIRRYLPVDISGKFLSESVGRLKADYPELQIVPVIGDYTRPFHVPVNGAGARNVVYFPGSTIGNFMPARAQEFLKLVAGIARPHGGMLIGVDLKKDRKVLEAAYNDSDGITAEFNKNILHRINRELGADFDPARFEHHAFYNEREGRIEMHLKSLGNQRVRIGDRVFAFRDGETIHTENSYKYTLDEFEQLVTGIFEVNGLWTDEDGFFSVQYAVPVQS